MPDLTSYQKDSPIAELRELNRGTRGGMLTDTVFKLLVAAVVSLGARVLELEEASDA